jgi:hypothetical protein
VTIVEKPFEVGAICRRLAFFSGPEDNLIELAQIIANEPRNDAESSVIRFKHYGPKNKVLANFYDGVEADIKTENKTMTPNEGTMNKIVGNFPDEVGEAQYRVAATAFVNGAQALVAKHFGDNEYVKKLLNTNQQVRDFVIGFGLAIMFEMLPTEMLTYKRKRLAYNLRVRSWELGEKGVFVLLMGAGGKSFWAEMLDVGDRSLAGVPDEADKDKRKSEPPSEPREKMCS